jgi:zinc D-Ala-D-Ala dipeptidase
MAYTRPSRGRRSAVALLAVAAAVTAAPAASAAPVRTGHEAAARHAAHDPEAPRQFVALDEVDPTILREMRYPTAHNFTGAPVKGYREPTCLVTRDTAEALHKAQRSFLRRGYGLKVYDCYRPQRAVDSFVAWAKRLHDTRMKDEFYPRVKKNRLFKDGYIAAKSGHSRGSTVDLTLVKLPARPTRPYVPGERLTPCYAARGDRFPDNSLDMGTGFDCFDTLAHTGSPRVKGEQRANRTLLKHTLEAAGMENLPTEWWHFTLKDETFPHTYFDFPVWRRALDRR